ncbi:hypothetical protein ACWDNR_22305, partial [Gordonia aichiensis]
RDRATGEWIDGHSLFLTVSCWRRLVNGVPSMVPGLSMLAPVAPAGSAPEPPSTASQRRSRIYAVVIFFEILLVLAAVAITWFALYVLYRLVTDES